MAEQSMDYLFNVTAQKSGSKVDLAFFHKTAVLIDLIFPLKRWVFSKPIYTSV